MNLRASSLLRMKKNKVCVILDNITISVLGRPLEENNKWRVSYLSGLSFAENKRDFPCSSLTEPVILPVINLTSRQQHRLLHTWYAKTLHNHMPIRTFKSQRSLKMELEQNPTLTSRIKKWLGLSSNLNVVRHIYSNNFTILESHFRINRY